jgi:hypothetical protein
MSKWGNFGRLSKDWKRIHPQAHREFEFKFHDVSTFNVAQLFNFKYHLVDDIERGKLTKEWLNRVLIKLYVTMKNNR